MNYLQLVQKLHVEAGASGTPPATVLAQKGEAARMVSWINDAWFDIQNEFAGWDWTRASFSFPTINGQAEYTPAQCGVTDFGLWARDTFRTYHTATGLKSENYLRNWAYDDWRDTYLFGNNRTVYSEPIVFAIKPTDSSICLGSIPDGNYTVIGDYFRSASTLTLDADIPALPVQYHRAIVFRALEMYGMYEAAEDAIRRGQIQYKRIITPLRINQKPEPTFGGALA